MEQVTYTNKISYKRVLKLIEESLFKQHLENEINENMSNINFNPNKLMTKYALETGFAKPNNGYISPEARQKAKKKKKRKKKK